MEEETARILEQIRRKRTEKNISLAQLAADVGISNSHLYYIESKRVIPSIDVFVKISKALETNIEEFLKEPR